MPSDSSRADALLAHFSEEAAALLRYAYNLAGRRRKDLVEPEQLLAVLVLDREEPGYQILQQLNVHRNDVLRLFKPAPPPPRKRSLWSWKKEIVRRSERLDRVIELAYEQSQHTGDTHIRPEHLLLGLVQEAGPPVNELPLNLETVRQAVRAWQATAVRYDDLESSQGVKWIYWRAFALAESVREEILRPEHVLQALLMEPEPIGAELLRSYGVNETSLAPLLPEPRLNYKPASEPLNLRFGSRADKARIYSRQEAAKEGKSVVGTEHLALGLVGEANRYFESALGSFKIEPDKMRKKMKQMRKTVT